MHTKALCMALVLFGGLTLALSGCGSTTNNESPAADDSASEADGTDTTSGGSSDTTGSGGGPPVHTSATGETGGTTSTTTGGCIPGIPATSQLPRLRNREYDAIIDDLLGTSSLAAADGQAPSSLLSSDDEGEMNEYAWKGYLEAAARIAEQVIAGDNRSRFMSCDPAVAPTCYEDTIRTFGRKIFRRPLSNSEIARFMALTEVDSSWTPDQISEAILVAFLASPSFIMVPELAGEPEGTAFKLSSHEVATRLSLMLWGSVPDGELEEAADRDLLTTPEQIRAQAERMVLQRDRAGPQVSEAHQHYLESSSDSGHWWNTQHDPALYPHYTDSTRVALRGEVAAFFEEIAYEGGSFQDIFLSNIAFVNRDTAALYGLDASQYGTDLTRVELDATRRPGIFTRAGFLGSYSSYDATNPILRGSFLAISVLSVDPGPPDPEAVIMPVPPGEYATRREQIEALTTSHASCAACHTLINAPGFVLENFDAVGSWQDVDPLGGPIDPIADVTFADGSVKTIGSPLELMQAVAVDPVARHLYAQKLVSFFTGRKPNTHDACMVETITANLALDGYRLLDVVVDLTQAESFHLRTVSD